VELQDYMKNALYPHKIQRGLPVSGRLALHRKSSGFSFISPAAASRKVPLVTPTAGGGLPFGAATGNFTPRS
jgi:hypothetical protein